jgi:hypothetical protein
MVKSLIAALLVLTFTGAIELAAIRAETADSILANKKRQNAPVLPPTGASHVDRPSKAVEDALVCASKQCRNHRLTMCKKNHFKPYCVCRPTLTRC